MNSDFFGMKKQTFNLMLIIILLVILGIVTFNVYAYISARKKISVGMGADMGIKVPNLFYSGDTFK